MNLLDRFKKSYNNICEKTSYMLSNVTKNQIEMTFGIAGLISSVCIGHVTSKIVSGTVSKDEEIVGKIVTAIGVTMISSALSTGAMKEINNNCEDIIKELDELGYFKEDSDE